MLQSHPTIDYVTERFNFLVNVELLLRNTYIDTKKIPSMRGEP